jgi:hypothetical protein
MWTADIATDPDRDHRLYLELLEDEEFRGRVIRADDGQVRITFYEAVADVPWDWLAATIESFKRDIKSA